MTTQNYESIFLEMGILDILELEQENTQITLHKEGLFVRVYERSAYLFVKQINKKFEMKVKPAKRVEYVG